MLPPNLSGGPMNLGDPDDKTLRKAEIEILIPKKLLEKAKKEKCAEEVKAFSDCCSANGIMMTFRCKPQCNTLTKCLEKWCYDEELKNQAKEEYLKERSEYRRTGVRKKFEREPKKPKVDYLAVLGLRKPNSENQM
ncbi:COX assembly mitochondrial protein [Caerostris darwini]|uniref:COX assembly mitochondrial protein n=2 Tax=Caerostris TaxID=172845 RepID=A0AAV4TNU7_9ARAC|nr:COX assembly mitochondrial protein [Caerostris extrusa]GIY45603.1 COX assembly mitochondrial protein [Caerostris darwini]